VKEVMRRILTEVQIRTQTEGMRRKWIVGRKNIDLNDQRALKRLYGEHCPEGKW
jgi:hypothetical protein